MPFKWKLLSGTAALVIAAAASSVATAGSNPVTTLNGLMIERGLVEVFEMLTREQAEELPAVMKDIRSLGLGLDTEVAAADTMLRLISESSDSILSSDEVDSLSKRVLDEISNESIQLAKSTKPKNPQAIGRGTISSQGKERASEQGQEHGVGIYDPD